MPNVKPGCIIEYRYKRTANYYTYLPTWDFQDRIPVRYSELNMTIPDVFYFRKNPHFNLPLAKHTTSMDSQVLQKTSHTLTVGATTSSDQQTDTYPYNENIEVWGMGNIPSLYTDAYTSSFADNVQRIGFDFVSMKPIGGFETNYSNNWARVGGALYSSTGFGEQLSKGLSDENDVIGRAAQLKSVDEKIAFVFDSVRNRMKWNGFDRWYTIDGTSKAWNNKQGNSTEINLILYHLLRKLNIGALPMVVSTRKNGKASPYSTSVEQFNRTVVYVPVDDTKSYVLDATGKFNLYNETSPELLNSFGLWIDPAKKVFDTVSIQRNTPVRQVVLINAEIKPDGKMEGTAQINASSYDREDIINHYKSDGEKVYMDSLRHGDNNLKITSVKFENMQVDTLPLTENITFDMNLSGSDGTYIYVNPNLFTSLKTNPFLSETRMTDIYFGFLRNYSINSVLKLPAGYKVDALPKSASMVIPDKSISFKRVIAEQDGAVMVRYIINFTRKAFNTSEYQGIHDFYKKMYEMLNEQIVLKKI